MPISPRLADARLGISLLFAAAVLISASARLPAATVPFRAQVLPSPPTEPGAPLPLRLSITNLSANRIDAAIEFSIQQDSLLFPEQAPDPEYGRDHALRARSWTEADAKPIEEGSLTDGQDSTHASTPWKTAHYTEAFQFIDLGRERRITHLTWRSGDANWTWKLDVDASLDGQTYRPVPSLQNLDLHQKWGIHAMPLSAPFSARFLRLRYHNNGKKMDVIRMAAGVSVFDGLEDEQFEIPAAGKTVARQMGTATLEPAAAIELALPQKVTLPPGAYFIAAKVSAAGRSQLIYARHLVLPQVLEKVSPASRFGLNASDPALVKLNRRLGVGWVRFENMKWPMVSPSPGVYRFDGSVGPWHVPHDGIVGAYAAEGISVLPFLFQIAPYASSAPDSVRPERRWAYPPKDPASFAEFCFQTASRYGQQHHPDADLKSSDHRSGLGWINTFEIWNEPNLTSPDWGPWVGTQPQYMELFRAAAEAIRRADPRARVTNGGYAGIKVQTLQPLLSYRYSDGKRPLDFVDILNVHYYSGREIPELATIDTNARRDQLPPGGATYEQDIAALLAWRNQNKPDMPVWLTETGYDTDGPIGLSERVQAARLPRVIMLALAEGIDKVFVYREKGSKPGMHAASGLVRDDNSLKPSWLSYATLIRQLDGATAGRRIAHPDRNVRLYAWSKPDGQTLLTAWCIDGAAPLGIDLGPCTVTDAFGAQAKSDASKDLPLSIFPVYFSGLAPEVEKRLATSAAHDQAPLPRQ